MRPQAEVLLVDDSPADIDLTREALNQHNSPFHIRVATDGIEAMKIIRGQDEHADEILPDLVILDLNLPGKDGRSVLSEVKTDPALRTTPVVIFSTSSAQRDVMLCYQLGANSYVTKPGNLQDFMAAVASLENYWFNFTRLPRGEE